MRGEVARSGFAARRDGWMTSRCVDARCELRGLQEDGGRGGKTGQSARRERGRMKERRAVQRVSKYCYLAGVEGMCHPF